MNPDCFGERYDLHRPLWSDGPHGGWLALDRTLGREVVVNFPYRPDDDYQFLQRAQIRAALRHANIIPLYELEETTDGRPFFSEPHIKATNIRTLLDGDNEPAGVTLPRLVAYLLDGCKAVAFLHANGFLHLEMHPRNVLVVPASNEVFVVRGHPSLPPVCIDSDIGTKGLMTGVPAYMAPEQVNQQELGTPDVLTDVYGLGGVLFEIHQGY
jgi:serine/threonine protein kinase